MELLINSLPCTIKQGTSIKLTRENTIVSDAGDWSFDVTLPLNGCPENAAALGAALHRPEQPLSEWAGKRMPFSLLASPLKLTGVAVITTITQEEAKVQLLAGRSDFNSRLAEDYADTTLDRLDLGTLLDNVVWQPDPTSGDKQTYTIVSDERFNNVLNRMLRDERDAATATIDSVVSMDRGYLYTGNEYDAIIYPIKSNDDDTIYNKKSFFCLAETNADGTTTGNWVWTRFMTPLQEGSQYYSMFYRFSFLISCGSDFAPQPKLMHTLEKVITALGFSVGTNDLRTSWKRDIAIVNTRITATLNKILPKWTVQEFFDECRHFLGVELLLEGNTVNIVLRNNYAQQQKTVFITQPIDDTEVTLDEETQSDSLIDNNKCYKDFSEDCPMLCLPEDIYEHAVLTPLSDNTDLSSLTHTGNLKRIYQHKGKYYAFLTPANDTTPVLTEIDQLPPFSASGNITTIEGREGDVEMRIRPAQTTIVPFAAEIARETGSWGTGDDKQTEFVYLPIPSTNQSTAWKDENWTVNGAINQNDEAAEEENREDERPDIIEVFAGAALHTGKKDNLIPYAASLAYGLTYAKDPDTGLYIKKLGYVERFSLNDFTLDTIGKHISVPYKTDTRLVRRIKFTDNLADYNPLHYYIIRGRKYVCQKIELTITEKGIDPVKTGYFHELNE